jgi:prepilin-type N-terminal cleavage/methylation domain-containing protein
LTGQRGFTLLEALVALAVLSTVLAAAFGVFSSGLKALSRGDERLTLALIAESLLERADVDLVRTRPEASGTMADGVSWRVTRTPYDPALLREGLTVVEAAPPPRRPGEDRDLLAEAAGEGPLPREEGERRAEAGTDGARSGFGRGGGEADPGAENGFEAGRSRRPTPPVRLRAWLLRAEVADARGGSFALSRLAVERAR